MSDKVQEFDFTGLKCPLPVLKARRALKDMIGGTVAVFLVDDPSAPLDFEHFCETTGHQLIEMSQEGEIFAFKIQKQG